MVPPVRQERCDPAVAAAPAKGPSIPPAAAGERSERKPGRTRRAAAPPL